MLQSKKESYQSNTQQLNVEHLVCSDCRAKFIRAKLIKKSSGSVENSRTTSFNTIDFSETECPICNNHKYDVQDKEKDKKELLRVIAATESDNTSIKSRCKRINQSVNGLWNITHEIGKFGNNKFGRFQFLPTKYAAECTRCGYIKIIEDEDIENIGTCVCNVCKQYLVNQANKKYTNIVNTLKPIISELETYKNNEVDTQTEEDIQEINKAESSAVSKMRKSIESYHNNLELLSVYKDGDLKKATVCCKVCGTPREVSIHRIDDLKDYKCSGCKEQEVNPNYLGVYKRDITNTTKNGLVVTEHHGDKVTLKCQYCDSRYKNKNKTAFLLGKIFCNKKESCSSVDVMCPKCYYTNTFRNKEISESEKGQLLCKKCNADLYLDARNDIIATDSSIEIKTGLRYFSGMVQKPVEFEHGIARTKDELYRGTDGLDYYNCRCTIHNQSCILNEDEMKIAPHKYCNNMRNIFVDEIDFKYVKLNREASAADK